MPEKTIRLGGVDVDVGPLLSDPAARKAFGQVVFELHDPIYAIVGFSELLIAELAPIASSQHLQRLRYIHQSASFLLQIRNNLLDAGRDAYEAERQQPNIAAVTQERSPTGIECPSAPSPPIAPVPSVRPEPTYFSDTAKVMAADLVRKLQEPLNVLINTAEALQPLPPPPNEHCRELMKYVAPWARHVEQLLKELLECRWKGEVAHSMIFQWAFEARDVLRPNVGCISELILAGHVGPIDERMRAYCTELHAAGQELVDKLGKVMSLARIDTETIERDGEIVTLQSALERGWL